MGWGGGGGFGVSNLQEHWMTVCQNELMTATIWNGDIGPQIVCKISYPSCEFLFKSQFKSLAHYSTTKVFHYLVLLYFLGSLLATAQKAPCSFCILGLVEKHKSTPNYYLILRSKPQKATRCKGNVTSTYFIFEISEINQHRQFATPILSHAVFTDTYEWKVGIRLYPNGVDSGWGSHVAVFVHLMNGEYDDLLDWPFPGIITLSVLDQSGARNHISRVLQTKPNLLAFQKPDDAICRTGCGFVKFAPIEVFFRPQYVKNDKMFLKIEFSA